ncbi:aminotransferase class I/II-fold pyridoxal phosphate-dependent enzyme [Pseudomonas sichuanensis]|uniref:pyridoxal phosphate-dependent aminotransferase n=1 Tax=Pseudomonas sichuanensis TaxID=2213015 RepID=UPI00244C3E9F|nr:aminotransferase class I/II-fold pyridoxal phosphate-dependent enzyme [Pseudomonas sichuanensis]MDH0729801.1 aminotransferase class I/II-fold pyridoxal phosphate-dependent enzyme [Pseudomonas sichuanensis]MDH1582477.1 aminotransferase class I/II-fold pyridoxal phosphate-dependent enzyme [Pseudomonas sichuanensis]MDH1591172.1 aminotransferase class I/II-fold pyridoxal phosphate-dependent enzyme [Pseudomonas sichuanensis]MDH1597470.1 aminotransferase class I/II-fold pyridoxal phosphate-depende
MRFSSLTQRIAGDGAAAWEIHYRALAMLEQGRDVLLLSVGDPDFDTPAPIVQAAMDSLQAGNTHYADVRGKRSLREAIARRHQQRSGQAVTADQVTVLAGAQCALFCVAQCVLEPGDEVIVAEPMYVTYEAVFGACGAKVIPVPVRPEHGFRVQPEDVAARITPRTRALALNSPHNPSGASLPRSTWEALAELCIGHDLWLISDEVYSELLFDGEHISPASLPGMAERTATLNSLSKSHAMTGWRVGWVVGSPALAGHLENLALCMLYGSPDFIQDAAVAALEQPLPELEAMREAYRQRRDLVCACLADCPGVRALKPDGGMFVMVDIRETGLSAQDFSNRLLDLHGVSVLAGEAFGPSAAGHIRLGLVLGAEPLREACRRIVLCAGELMEAQRNA